MTKHSSFGNTLFLLTICSAMSKQIDNSPFEFDQVFEYEIECEERFAKNWIES